MSRWIKFGIALALATLSVAFQRSDGVVRALLFFSPTCPHCHAVMAESLPPIMAHYQDQLQIVAIDTTTQAGHELYLAAIQTLGIPEDRRGVPTMVVGSTVMVGSVEIPDMLPGLVEAGLAQGGVGWPDIPGLEGALPADPGQSTAPVASPPTGLWTRFTQDLVGNGLALLVLLGTLGTLAWSAFRLRGRMAAPPSWVSRPFWSRWAFPLIAFAGVGISIYLTYIESSGTLAVCGPIGDCNAVQQSQYAHLFGVLPIAGLGVLGFGLLLAVHTYRKDLDGQATNRAALVLLALALGGTAFSAYLTFLEAFIIGAVCAWCLTSAVLMTLLLVLTLPGARDALTTSRPRPKSA